MFVHGAIEIAPLAFHFDIRFIHAPADPHRLLAPMERLFELWAIFEHPSVNGGVIHVHPTFLHEFFDMACAQWIRHVPPHTHENDLLRKMCPLKADRHRRSPSLCTLGYRERAYPKWLHMKIATKPTRVLAHRHGGSLQRRLTQFYNNFTPFLRPSY